MCCVWEGGRNEEQVAFSDAEVQCSEGFPGVKIQTPQPPVLDIVQGVRAAGTREGDVQGGLTPCSLLPLETRDLGLSRDVLPAPQRPLAVVWSGAEQTSPTSSLMAVGLLWRGSVEREMLDKQACTGAGFGPGIYAYIVLGIKCSERLS